MTAKGDTKNTKDANNEDNPMRKLEEAMSLCKFGKFQIKLLIATLICVMATNSVTTATSYVLPSAECDLDMDLMQKGLLNAIPFLGQVCACFFTGFVTDAFGRKIFLVWGNFALFLCAVFGASSQTYAMLVFAKLLEGLVMSIAFTATATMVSEFTHKEVRDRILLFYSSFLSLSIIVVALLAWAMLPWSWHFVLVPGYFEIHSWNLYLYASACWSLIASILYWHLPESPKFLLSHGQENEALEVLKEIYHTNTGKDKESFPITSLNISGVYKPTVEISLKKKLVDALFDVKELFRRPLVFRLLLFSSITYVCLLVYSALRLWFPQLSTMVETYQKQHNGEMARFCIVINDHYERGKVLNDTLVHTTMKPDICVPKISGAETYTNGMILGFVSGFCICVSGFLVNLMGQKPLMVIFFLLCAACSGSLYWTNSSIQIAILISATCGFMQTAFSLQHNILVRVFPTTVRTVALSLVVMVGRIGSLMGNILFPIMLEGGCMTPFLTLTVVTLVVAGLVYFLPNPNEENNGTGDK